ncbi:sorting nexin 2A-like [Andrographis paniculata]|uniref:sorting nexin 2A-like n=1 Tax=Andrographis paniculata TaxID=175694 RepID=UPI0021E70BBD|nr:sorting nexin 2A-like [Andrographis paniculata]
MMAAESNHPLAEGVEQRGGGGGGILVHDHPLAASDRLQTLSLDDDDGKDNLAPASSSGATRTVSDPLLFPEDDASLDSSSYEEVVASSLHDSNGNGSVSDEPTKSSSESSSVSEYLKISVTDPQKEIESSNSIVPGGSTYVTYLITTSTNIDVYGGSSYRVRRRFRDVVALADRLSESHRGFFIPARPDKSVVESQVMQKHDFVEQRRVELEKYLRRLARHPVIKKSEELRVFLTAHRMLDGAARLPKQLTGDSSSVAEPQDVVQPAKGGRDMLRFFKELKQAVVNDWGSVKPAVEEEDKDFLKKKEKLLDLEQQLTNMSKQAESLVKAQQDMGETMGELGLAFMKLTKFETEKAILNTQRVRAAEMKTLATAAVKASRLYRELNSQTVKHFDILHEHMGMMLAVNTAFSDRSSALLTVQTLIAELSSLHSKAEKLESASSKIFGADKSRTSKLQEVKDTIRVTEDAKSCGIKEYERIKENNRIEIARVDKERKSDFVDMLKGFVTNQITYNQKIGIEWAKVVEETSKYAKQQQQSTGKL